MAVALLEVLLVNLQSNKSPFLNAISNPISASITFAIGRLEIEVHKPAIERAKQRKNKINEELENSSIDTNKAVH